VFLPFRNERARTARPARTGGCVKRFVQVRNAPTCSPTDDFPARLHDLAHASLRNSQIYLSGSKRTSTPCGYDRVVP